MKPPFFIVGAGRSGTTLLRLMLCGHRELFIPPEAWFLGDMMWCLPLADPLGREHLLECEKLILASDRWKDWKCPEEKLRQILAGCAGLDQAQMIDRLFRSVFELPLEVRWGEKSPKHSYIATRIGRIFPGSQFVHLIRDGRDVTSSMLARGWFGGSARRVAEHWERCVRASSQAKEFGSDRYLEVRFEDLIARPESELRRICGFLRVDFEPRMLSYRDQVGEFIPAGEAAYHAKLNAGLSTNEVGKWMDTLGPWQEAVFWAVVGGPTEQYLGDPDIRGKARLLLPAAKISVCVERLLAAAHSKVASRGGASGHT